MRLQTAQQAPDEYIQHHLGFTLNQLMAPIGDTGVGESVRHNGVYFNIKEAREADDPTLPLGVWTHELKTADWHQVKQLALNALADKSKDLQLGVWLFEANIHLNGFAGIAPAALLILALCQQYWPDMHPQMVDGDIEYRTNPLNWLNDKLTPVLRLIPITNAKLDGIEFNWDDWENAKHYEKLKEQHQLKTKWDGPTPKSFKQKLGATSSEELLILIGNIEDGLIALDELQAWLDECCEDEAPNLTDMCSMLNQIDEMIAAELGRRGVTFQPDHQQQNMAAQGDGEGGEGADGEGDEAHDGGSGGGGGQGDGPIRDRTDAFIALRKAAEFLMNDDPHSPVPYLVYTACDWGEKTAPDLYQELFLAKGGQLNIFEMMGLKAEN